VNELSCPIEVPEVWKTVSFMGKIVRTLRPFDLSLITLFDLLYRVIVNSVDCNDGSRQ